MRHHDHMCYGHGKGIDAGFPGQAVACLSAITPGGPSADGVNDELSPDPGAQTIMAKQRFSSSASHPSSSALTMSYAHCPSAAPKAVIPRMWLPRLRSLSEDHIGDAAGGEVSGVGRLGRTH